MSRTLRVARSLIGNVGPAPLAELPTRDQRQISAPPGKEREGFYAVLEGDERVRTFVAVLAWQAPAGRPAVPGTAKALIVAYRGARGRTRAAWELTWLMILCSSFPYY